MGRPAKIGAALAAAVALIGGGFGLTAHACGCNVTAPEQSAPPSISGTTTQGQILTAVAGSWLNSPTSRAYQWRDCNSSGTSCADVPGATSSTYTLQGGDVGDTVRVIETAINASGHAASASSPTAVVAGSGSGDSKVGAPSPPGVTCTGSPLNAGANVQTALSSASPGSTVCLNSGSWSAISLSSVNPASNITLAATPGQTVVIPGFNLGGTLNNLTIEGFSVTTPATGNTLGGNSANGIQVTAASTGGLIVQYNTIANQGNNSFGIYLDSHVGGVENGVTFQHNWIDNVSGGAEFQTYARATNLTFSHNVMQSVQAGGFAHYIEDNGGINGFTVDNNLFMGPSATTDCNPSGAGSHLNVLHVNIPVGTTAESNISFDNNIVWHDQSCGQAVLIQDGPLSSLDFSNNLFVADPNCATLSPFACDASAFLIQASNGMTANHNTIVNELRGVYFGQTTGTTISNPNTMTAQDNIDVPGTQGGEIGNYEQWNCTATCSTGLNTSFDATANSIMGGSGNVANWTPNWQSTTWTWASSGGAPPYAPPPSNYYQPSGLSVAGAGYQGSPCTASVQTNCIGP